MFSLFLTRRFYPLFNVQFLGSLNDNAFKNAFIVWFSFGMAERLGLNADLIVSIAAGLFILPFFLFSALAGTFADRYDKQVLAKIIKIAEIFIMIIGVIAFYMESVYGLLAVLFALGTQSSFFGPIKYSLLPVHLKKDELLMGNSLVEAGTFLSVLAGTIAGGLLIRLDNGTLYIAILVLLVSIIGWINSLLIPPAAPTEQGKKLPLNWNIVTNTYHLISGTFQDKSLKQTIFTISWFWFIGSMFLMKLPMYTQEFLKGDEGVLTFFLSLFSIGIAVGSWLCHVLSKNKIRWLVMYIGFVGLTITIALFFIVSLYGLPSGEMSIQPIYSVSMFLKQPNSWLLVIIFVGVALFSGMFIVPLYTSMQAQANSTQIGRVIATNNVINAFIMVLASLVAGIVSLLGFSLIWNFALLTLVNLILITAFIIKKPLFIQE